MKKRVIDLSTIVSPYAFVDLHHMPDDVTVGCGQGPDQGFSINLLPFETLRIRQSTNDFDSRHTLRWGGEYPGTNSDDKYCKDDPDEYEMVFTNTDMTTVPVYFIVDYWSSSSFREGSFTLEWSVSDEFAR